MTAKRKAEPGGEVETAAPASPKSSKATPVVKVIVRVEVSGSRNGQLWPAIGEVMELPADEAAQYLAAGYVELDK